MSFQPNSYSPPPGPQGYVPQPQKSPMPMILAVSSLVTGVMGLLSCFCCVFIPLPPISLLLGIVALCVKPDSNEKIMAIVGIALSALTLVIFLISVLFFGASLAIDPAFQKAFQ